MYVWYGAVSGSPKESRDNLKDRPKMAHVKFPENDVK